MAQQAMACWAEWAFLATASSVLVSAFALVGLFRSLSQTKRAIKDAREIGETQVQAYIHVSSAEFGANENIIIKCKNTGASPASHFSVNGVIKTVAKGSVSASVEFPRSEFKTFPALGAGDELSVGIDVSNSLIRKFKRGEFEDDVLMISGSVIYCTVFDHDHITDYVFFINPSSARKFQRPVFKGRAFHRLPK